MIFEVSTDLYEESTSNSVAEMLDYINTTSVPAILSYYHQYFEIDEDRACNDTISLQLKLSMMPYVYFENSKKDYLTQISESIRDISDGKENLSEDESKQLTQMLKEVHDIVMNSVPDAIGHFDFKKYECLAKTESAQKLLSDIKYSFEQLLGTMEVMGWNNEETMIVLIVPNVLRNADYTVSQQLSKQGFSDDRINICILEATLAHELYHSFHKYSLEKAGGVWKDYRDTKFTSISESLAEYFAFSYMEYTYHIDSVTRDFSDYIFNENIYSASAALFRVDEKEKHGLESANYEKIFRASRAESEVESGFKILDQINIDYYDAAEEEFQKFQEEAWLNGENLFPELIPDIYDDDDDSSDDSDDEQKS